MKRVDDPSTESTGGGRAGVELEGRAAGQQVIKPPAVGADPGASLAILEDRVNESVVEDGRGAVIIGEGLARVLSDVIDSEADVGADIEDPGARLGDVMHVSQVTGEEARAGLPGRVIAEDAVVAGPDIPEGILAEGVDRERLLAGGLVADGDPGKAVARGHVAVHACPVCRYPYRPLVVDEDLRAEIRGDGRGVVDIVDVVAQRPVVEVVAVEAVPVGGYPDVPVVVFLDGVDNVLAPLAVDVAPPGGVLPV